MRPPRSVLRSIGKWAAELLLVFLGAYAAFWLANHQEHLQEARRRQLILAALEEQFANDIDNVKAQRDRTAKGLAAFQKKLEAGEMPPLNSFSFTTDYNATDIAALLQSGGYQLLDVKTLFALRQLESVLRRGVSTMQRAQQLSDSLIVPNLDQDKTFFYDPATKQLRKRFTRYVETLQAFPPFYDDYIKALTDLLTQIRAERAKQ
ncbi:MAG: hypothetical protein QOJ87_2599 [Verrucomicrobiota bacterium]|jgi:hypothetical protein